MRKTIQTVIASALIAMGACAMAQQVATAAAPAAPGAPTAVAGDPGMMATLRGLYPQTQFKEVNRTNVPGVFEVVMGQNVAYVDQTGRYFFFGRMFDMQTQQDLTSGKLEDSGRIDMSQLKKEDAIKVVKGNGKRTLYVFSDPDCPFCKQLEKNLSTLNDVTIYTFMFPLESLHPDAKRKAVAVWCAKDKAKAWDDLMNKGTEAKGANCDNPVDRNMAVAERFGITGTPTLIAADGRKLPGAASASSISSWLDSGKTVQ
jgi:thiol:disulfide interchange protein DsbC